MKKNSSLNVSIIKSLDEDDDEYNEIKDDLKELSSSQPLKTERYLDWVTTQTSQMVHFLKKEAKELDKKRKIFESELKLVKSAHFPDPIILNIGGLKYATSKNTLIRFQNTFFAKMFSGKFSLTPLKDGSFFIDRDGTHFRYILNYFRTGEILIPNDIFIRKELLKECSFYQISKLVDYLTVPIYIDSKILNNNNNEMKLLNEWVFEELFDNGLNVSKKLNLNWKLLYRGSDDGFTASKYHKLCDGYSQTVHLILSEHGNVFGGYTPIEIESVTGGKRYEDSTLTTFVFLLRQNVSHNSKYSNNNSNSNNNNNNNNNHNNHSNSHLNINQNIGKFKLNPNKFKEAIHQNKNYLSIFGDADGYTFMIYNNANQRNDNYSNPRGCFELPQNHCNDDTFLPGSREFKINDIEVFHVS